MPSKPPKEPRLRWTLTVAAKEFDTAKETLRRRLGECHQKPGRDQCYTTRQLTEALYGDLYGAKLRTQNEQAEKLRLENEFTRAEVLNRRELMGVLSRVADAVVSRVMSSSLERTIKEDILRDIASIPVALQETADKQTRLPRGNGHRHNVDDDEQSES